MGIIKGRTARTWEWWGQREPYFGVLTDEKFKAATFDRHRHEFFRSGEDHLAGVLARIERAFGPIPRGSALDFGCGVGRILLPLAQSFTSVTGLDISPAMLAEARRNLDARAITGVELQIADDQASPLGGRAFDFVHSYIVLQHMARRQGYRAISRMADQVNPGGAIFLHLGVRQRGSGLGRLHYRLVNDLPGGYVLARLLTGQRLTPPPMRMSEYDLSIVGETLQMRGFTPIMVEFEQHGPTLTACLYARRR
ncbi:MAG: methyltransferase domain-containing protein [Aliidongia sp.]